MNATANHKIWIQDVNESTSVVADYNQNKIKVIRANKADIVFSYDREPRISDIEKVLNHVNNSL